MVVFNNPGYYHALDNTFDQAEHGPDLPLEIDGEEWHTELGPKELGTSANPMQNQIQALQAKIREGASRVELNFPGAGKGSSQSPTPEAYGSREREDIRNLAKVSGIKTTTHATFSRQGFSGFDPQNARGFSDEQRFQNVKEIKKAIQFAAEATTGGAVVFHTGEWNRAISESWGKGKDQKHKDVEFRAYDEEPDKASFLLVDERTGQFVSQISKDRELFRPVYKTAKELSPEKVGQYDELKKDVINEDDYVDLQGRWIDVSDPKRAFERIPEFDEKNTNFKIEKYTWNRVEEETDKWNSKFPKKQLTPQMMYHRIEVEQQILQAKGSSLYHAQRYNEEKYQAKKLREALEFYKKLDKSLPEDEKWKIMTQRGMYGHAQNHITPDSESIPAMLERELKQIQDQMRYVHEASAAADSQARTAEEMLRKVKTVEEYGIKKSAQGIAEAGMYAYQQTNKNRKNLEEDIYVAPENWQASQFGGHPDEMIELVKTSRKEMANRLQKMGGKSAEEAKDLAKRHIKSTIDIGHLNLWRTHFVARPGESEAAKDRRFNKWAIDKTKEMINAGIIGHLHIADNLGWDDEHLTPGEGNAPIREFVKEMEKAGYKDFIIEPGSFNANRALPETLKYLGSPVYSVGTPMMRPMGSFREAHFGYGAPSNYIVGAYSPSNEWKLWSEVPLE